MLVKDSHFVTTRDCHKTTIRSKGHSGEFWPASVSLGWLFNYTLTKNISQLVRKTMKYEDKKYRNNP
jgi:hypothetical protein